MGAEEGAVELRERPRPCRVRSSGPKQREKRGARGRTVAGALGTGEADGVYDGGEPISKPSQRWASPKPKTRQQQRHARGHAG